VSYLANVSLDDLGVTPGSRVIDVGCGGGGLAELFARAGVHVTGVEPAAYLRERFEQRVSAVDPESRVLDGVGEHIPLADGEARAVVITEVLEHVADPAAVLTELARVTAPGGVVCLSVPTSYTELLFWRLHPRYAQNATHLRIFTRPELKRLVETSGFEIVRWEGRNFRPAVAWVFHALMRTPSDHAGEVLGNRWIDQGVNAVFHGLDLLGLGRAVDAIGNRVWAKSWYVYARRRA
jgi:2-polyprenyl-3-methyl-5-hydroxy-6-metoxy-1,4-benzoquinol methylase